MERMTSREELIEKARVAFTEAWDEENRKEWAPPLDYHRRSRAGIVAALAVFEEAHTPTDYTPNRVSTMDELVMLDSGTVLRGPDWHAEVYVKFSDAEFYAPGSPTPYRASEVQARGPYIVLWPFAAAEAERGENRG